MKTELRQLSPDDGHSIYHFLQSLPNEENGFMNPAHGLKEEEFPVWLAQQDAIAHGKQLPEGWVAMSAYWFLVNDEVVGYIRLRHELNEALLAHGGHIGYSIAPHQRKKGYAKLMLQELLHVARQKGLQRVLLTTNIDNIASQKTIEACGGTLWKEEQKSCYYWILLGQEELRPLHSERLILRPFEESDLEDFYAYAKEDGVGEMAGWPHHTSMEESKKILHHFIVKKEDYALVDRQNNHVIGSLGITQRMYDPSFLNTNQREIGYVLKKEYWGNGYMKEAVAVVLAYLFDECNIDIVWCRHFTFNDQSRRVIEKSGFQFYEDRICNVYLLHETYEEKVYILTKEAYYEQKKNQD